MRLWPRSTQQTEQSSGASRHTPELHNKSDLEIVTDNFRAANIVWALASFAIEEATSPTERARKSCHQETAYNETVVLGIQIELLLHSQKPH